MTHRNAGKELESFLFFFKLCSPSSLSPSKEKLSQACWFVFKLGCCSCFSDAGSSKIHTKSQTRGKVASFFITLSPGHLTPLKSHFLGREGCQNDLAGVSYLRIHENREH